MNYIVRNDPNHDYVQTPFLLEPLEYRNGWMTGVNTGTKYLKGRLDNSAGTDSSSGASATDIWYPNHKSLDFWAYDDSYEKIVVAVKIYSKCTFSGLPVYDPLGLEQKYVVKEAEIPVGYSTADVTVSGKDTVAADVTNKLETKDITVIKNWTDSNDHDRKRPESIVLKLFRDSELFKTKEINKADNSISANVWSYVFTDIPKLNERGEPAVYDVKEFPAE